MLNIRMMQIPKHLTVENIGSSNCLIADQSIFNIHADAVLISVVVDVVLLTQSFGMLLAMIYLVFLSVLCCPEGGT